MSSFISWSSGLAFIMYFMTSLGANIQSEQRLSHINIKYQSTQNITFLYDQTFRIRYAESNIKDYKIPPFCSLIQSHFSAVEAQKFDLSDYCLENCLVNYLSNWVYIVNGQNQLLVFQMQERQLNQDFRINNYVLILKSKIALLEDLQTETLKKSRLLVNDQTSTFPEAILMTSKSLTIYYQGTISSVQFDSSDFPDVSFKAITLHRQYLIIPDDSRGLQIYKLSLLSNQNPGIQMTPHLNITISQFFGEQEWEDIQKQINQQTEDGDGSSESPSDFEFNFGIESFQIQDQLDNTSLFFVSEQYSKSICIFGVDLVLLNVKLNSKIAMNGKIPSIVSSNNYLYAHQTYSKGLRESNYLVEMQSNTQPLSYLPRQTYPLTSSIQKVALSKNLVFSLQENIISIIRRQIPFKLTPDDARSQISILYSEGADDMWPFPVVFIPLAVGKDKKTVTTTNDSSLKGTLQEQLIPQNNDNYFSPNITLLETSTISFVDAILVKKDQTLSLLIIQERLPYLSCIPEDEENLSTEYQALISIEVFQNQDINGNVQLHTYQEGISVQVYKEIFESSTVALIVGLGIGLTLSLIVVIVFCIYFYRMKNHYQLLIDQTKDTDIFVSSSISSGSSDNNSADSYPPADVFRKDIQNGKKNNQDQEKQNGNYDQEQNNNGQQQRRQQQQTSNVSEIQDNNQSNKEKQQQSLNIQIIVDPDSYELPNPALSPHENTQNEEQMQQEQ